MAIEVCIKLDDKGAYTVGLEPAKNESMEMAGEMSGGMGKAGSGGGMMQGQGGESPAEDANMQPARDLNDALMIAGKLLSQKSEQGSSPFDEGLKKVLPQRQGMM